MAAPADIYIFSWCLLINQSPTPIYAATVDLDEDAALATLGNVYTKRIKNVDAAIQTSVPNLFYGVDTAAAVTFTLDNSDLALDPTLEWRLVPVTLYRYDRIAGTASIELIGIITATQFQNTVVLVTLGRLDPSLFNRMVPAAVINAEVGSPFANSTAANAPIPVVFGAGIPIQPPNGNTDKTSSPGGDDLLLGFGNVTVLQVFGDIQNAQTGIVTENNWSPAPGTPVYVSRTTFTVTGDQSQRYTQGLTSLAMTPIRKHLRPFFGTWNAASVTDDQVRACIATRMETIMKDGAVVQKGAKRSTVNRELSLLQKGYNLNKRTVTVRPEIPIATEKNARTGFFERAQFEAVRGALPDYLRPMLTVAYVTGWRIKSELLPMEWRQVDFRARTLRLDPGTTKNDKGREFPFTQELQAALLAQRASTDEVERTHGMICRSVFHRKGTPVRVWRRQWLKALLAVGLARREPNEDGTRKKGGKIIPAVIPHDFRRMAIRNLSRAGVTEAVAMKLCGHETRSVYDRYCIVSGDDLTEAAGKLDAAATGTVATLEAISGTATRAKSPKS